MSDTLYSDTGTGLDSIIEYNTDFQTEGSSSGNSIEFEVNKGNPFLDREFESLLDDLERGTSVGIVSSRNNDEIGPSDSIDPEEINGIAAAWAESIVSSM
ncbi:MAG: hypothetical protein WD492_12845 [Alkalispirochaeta sp.]